MKKWVEKIKPWLISQLALTVMLFIGFYFSVTEAQKFSPIIQSYFETKIYNPILNSLAITIMITLIILGVWILNLVVIFLKTIFPTKNSLKSAFAIDYAEDLENMISTIRGGLDHE